MKNMTMSITAVLALAALLLIATPAGADVILHSAFPTGDGGVSRTNDGTCVVGDITWTTSGVQDPGDLDFSGYSAPDDFITASNAADYIVPHVNTDNEGEWNVSIPLDITAPGLDIADVVLSGGMFKGNGLLQSTQQRDTNIKVSFVGSDSGEVAAQTIQADSKNTWDVTYSFGGSGVSGLMADEDWELVIETVNHSGPGNHTGIGELTVNGTAIPEPATMGLLGIGGLGVLLRRRNR